jgi:hypothetical protein
MLSWWRIETNIKDPFSLKKEDSNVSIYVYFIFHVCMRVIIQNKRIVASRHLEVIWGKLQARREYFNWWTRRARKVKFVVQIVVGHASPLSRQMPRTASGVLTSNPRSFQNLPAISWPGIPGPIQRLRARHVYGPCHGGG